MTAGLFWSLFVLVAVGWFAIGWVARGHENRRYAESRLRALAADAVSDAPRPVASQRLVAPQPPPAVVNVHLTAPLPAPQSPVITPTGAVLPVLPGRTPDGPVE